MKTAANIYDSPRLAAGYAFGRPPVHDAIVRHIARDLGLAEAVPRALDVGCGAGLSTAALAAIATTVVGIEPMETMLAHHRQVFPRGLFAIGWAEALPFRNGSFDLITAAGSINYTETSAFIDEAARVLATDGAIAIYDFSDGRRIEHDGRLEAWYEAYETRYPSQPGYALDVRELPFARAGLKLDRYRPFTVAIPMTAESYTRYAMSQTQVEAAIARGGLEAEIHEWCRATVEEIFGDRSYDVVFDAYVAYVTRTHDQGNAAGPVL